MLRSLGDHCTATGFPVISRITMRPQSERASRLTLKP
jgi:hypothetical protein